MNPSDPIDPSASKRTLAQEMTTAVQWQLLEADIQQWHQDLQKRLQRIEEHPEQGLGFIEEQVRQSALELQRKLLEKAMQAKADAVDERCPCCQSPLIERKRRIPKTIHSYCGAIGLYRTHGWCTKQLHDEAMSRGLGQAQQTLVLADGAIWIWNLVDNRFGEATQRLDLYHANAYLWAVANQIHGANTAEARKWVKPLLKQLRSDHVAKVISTLEQLQPQLQAQAAQAASKTIEYYKNNQKPMRYKQAEQRGEPLGSGAIESTCRQMQCRMKRCGQFWTLEGDEALLCLETFWRNDRWEILFPHLAITSPTLN